MESFPSWTCLPGLSTRIWDVLQNYVGTPDGQRYLTFFSFDAQIYRDFHMHLPFLGNRSRHKIRLGAYSINLTNHGNFNDVYNNVTSRFFGQFAGFQRRTDGLNHQLRRLTVLK